jgi:hypothetical protein
MPQFNRERLVIKLLRDGRGVLVQQSFDSSGVIAAGRCIAEALEHPSRMRWDPKPPSTDVWKWERDLVAIRREAIERHRSSKPEE